MQLIRSNDVFGTCLITGFKITDMIRYVKLLRRGILKGPFSFMENIFDITALPGIPEVVIYRSGAGSNTDSMARGTFFRFKSDFNA